jgi:hypothetical protein
MTDDASPAPQERSATGADPLPKHTTPTWEVELLISGVAVFAMLQLPSWLDDRYFDLLPRFGSDWHPTLLAGYLYLRITALILAVTFVTHLLLRAHWIALVGLDSVYPNGIRWDRVDLGPLVRTQMQRRMGSMADTIERADNRATIIFAAGVQMAMVTLKFVVLIALIAGSVLLADLVHPVPNGGTLVSLSLGAIMLPFVVAWVIDHRFGARLDPAGRTARCLGAIIRFYARIGFGHRGSPATLLITSHQGQRLSTSITLGIFILAGLLTMFQLQAGSGPTGIGSYEDIPRIARDAEDVLLPDHYDDQRDSQHLSTTPYIQSQAFTDPYLRLTIPIDPSVHNPAFHRDCAAVSRGSNDEARQRHDALACFAPMHPLQLDGHSVGSLRYDLGSDPRARRPALIAMIDVRTLANGRHELRIGQPVDPEGKPRKPDVIAFWR